MASVKVAVRVRPLNQRETDMNSEPIIEMEEQKTTIFNPKAGDGLKVPPKHFTFDYSYWSMDKENKDKFAAQRQVFVDLGMDVIKSAYSGYNACIFAYGQTGSGKTYTMMGNQDDVGLIPRICEELFDRMNDDSMSYRTEVSYLEIYNEKVRDLLRITSGKTSHNLRVREHPKEGPYVQDLSTHIVTNFDDIRELMERGNNLRTTACTNMNDTSSRSHAIFTIVFCQAKFSKNSPIETRSKIHLVDLAGSERANATGATGQRLKEGGSINKSLVTLGNVISTLADISEKSHGKGKSAFIPYRDSTLTWLLKDSLGGNAKTIMIATLSPAGVNYAETLSTLRYANRAKCIVNKPTVNEDPNVKLIRELRAEIERLKEMLGDNMTSPRVKEKLHESEARVKVLTEEWEERWGEAASILQEEKNLALRKERSGVVLDSGLPHLIGIDDNILSTGIMLYHLKEGRTTIGTDDAEHPQDIELEGPEVMREHCIFEHEGGVVTLVPLGEAQCMVNGVNINEPMQLSQGAVIILGSNMFRFNHPGQAQQLRKELGGSMINLRRNSILSQSMTDLCRSTDNLMMGTTGWEMEQRHKEQLVALDEKRREIEELEVTFQEREAVRLSEQQTKEKQLEEKKRKLESMLDETEKVKKEAEEVKMKAEKETAHWKRRSLDIEKQLTEYRLVQDRERKDSSCSTEPTDGFDVFDGNCKPPDGLEKSLKRKQLDSAKDLLEQELEKLKVYHQHEHANLQKELKQVESCLKEKQLELDVLRECIEEDEEAFTARINEGRETLTKEKEELDKMKTDYREFYTNCHNMFDSVTKERLQRESDKITQAQDSLSIHEKQLFEEYSQRKEEFELEVKERKRQVQEDWNILESDRVYVNELEENFGLFDPDKYADEEAFEQDKAAIEDEKERIRQMEKKLELREKDLEEEESSGREVIEQKRAEQVDCINKEKEMVQELKELWTDVVEDEIKQKDSDIALLDQRLEERQNEVTVAMDKLDHLQQEIAATELLLTEKRQELTNLEVRQEAEFRRATEEVNKIRLQINREMENEVSEIHHQLQSLAQLLGAPEDGEIINGQMDIFEKCRKFSEAAAAYNNKQKSSDSTTMTDCDVEDLESQLSRVEQELRIQRENYDLQRQEELDTIDLERFRLQEMEDQERINALVEQEVKRRLFEERVQREKMRRIEREKEKLEREREIWRIKKAHARDLETLRQQYDASNSMDRLSMTESLSSRSNPYGAFSRESDFGPHRRSSRMRSSLSMSCISNIQNNRIRENPFRVTVPSFAQRGSGLDSHYEFEVKCYVLDDTWSVFRRYTQFRNLHLEMCCKYPEINALIFPPKRWFGNFSERIASERKQLLEDYLQNMLNTLFRRRNCVLHPSKTTLYAKQVLCDFHPFFKQGIFENGPNHTS